MFLTVVKVDRFMDVLYKGVTGPVTITDTGKKTKVKQKSRSAR